MIHLDVDYIFDRLSGPRGLLELLDKHVPDHKLTYPQVQMWKQRGSVSARFVAAVIYALAREGWPPLACFRTDGEEF